MGSFTIRLWRRLTLVLDVAAVTKLVHPDTKGVLSICVDQVRDIKLGGVPGALRISNLGTIDPTVKGRVNPFKPKADLISCKFSGQYEFSNIASSLIIIVGD